MKIIEEIEAGLPEGVIEDIRIGEHWSAVLVTVDGQQRCGLASVPHESYEKLGEYQDELQKLKKQKSARALAHQAPRHGTPLASAGLACLNALIRPQPETWVDINAGEMLARQGKGKRVALIGHFPFIPDVRARVGELNVLELRPQEGDLHANESPRIIPHMDVVAITSMAFINGTMQYLLELCAPQAYIIILGPSTPLSPILFNHGIQMICGSVVEKINPVMDSVAAGDRFHQIQHQGVRLVTMTRP
ncbi:MAG: DUF364 domain-containing protein [Anaerolineales bacterium]|nr:DUF364 domain-containing protein [Anaerolineales bacterium]